MNPLQIRVQSYFLSYFFSRSQFGDLHSGHTRGRSRSSGRDILPPDSATTLSHSRGIHRCPQRHRQPQTDISSNPKAGSRVFPTPEAIGVLSKNLPEIYTRRLDRSTP